MPGSGCGAFSMYSYAALLLRPGRDDGGSQLYGPEQESHPCLGFPGSEGHSLSVHLTYMCT